jgi:arylsulfatase A-like enzyme
LDESGLAENTIVVYTSDQGFYLGEHGWYDKRFIYDESFKTPLLIRWPHVIEPGTTNEQMVQNLDFAQTFLEAAGIAAPADMQGESLIPLLRVMIRCGRGRRCTIIIMSTLLFIW